MYEYLEGRIELHSTTRLVVDVGGVGYELSVPLGHAWTVGARSRVPDEQLLERFEGPGILLGKVSDFGGCHRRHSAG